MATISQRIALEGAEEIRRQLQALGKAGTASFEQIEAAGIKAAQGLDRVVNSVARLERSFVVLSASAQAFGSSLSRAGAAFGSFEGAILRSVRNIGLLTAAVGGAAVGFGALVKNAADAADNIGEQAAGLGITTDRLQELGAAATDSGVDAETFGRGLGSLAKNIKEDVEKQLKAAAEHVLSLGRTFPKTAAGARAFADQVGRAAVRLQAINNAAGRGATDLGRLGIATLDAAGNMRNVDDVFLDVADAIAKLPAGTEKSALAMELFGAKIGRRFIDLLDKGSKGILELGKQFAALKFTPGEIQIGDDFAKQFGILSLVAERARQKLALLFGPSFTGLMGAFTERLLANFEGIHAGLKNVVDQAIAPVIADLITLISGEQTPIRTDWVRNLEASFERAGQVIGQAGRIIGAAFQALRTGAASIAGVINRIFGTDISGDALLLAAAVLKVTGVISLMVSGMALAGAATVAFVRTLALAGAAIRLLLAGFAAFTAIANPFATLIVGAGLLVAAYVLASDEVKATVNKLLGDLLLMAQEGASAVGQAIVSGLTNELGKLSIGSVLFQAMFNDLAAFGERVVDNGKILGLRFAQGFASQLALIDKFLFRSGLFAGLAAQFGKAADDIAAKAQELGLEITGQFGEAGEQAAETYLEKIQRIFKEGKAIGIGVDTKGIDEAARKTSTLDAMLKRLGITAQSTGKSGADAFKTMADAAKLGTDQLKIIMAELAFQQRMVDNAESAAMSRLRPIGAPEGFVPDKAGAAKPGAAGAIDTTAINTALNAIAAVGQSAATNLQTLTTLDFAGLATAFQGVTSAVQQTTTDLQGLGLSAVASAMQSVTDAANSAAEAMKSIQGGGGDLQELAGGGMIRGPGTGTSDSILARLSHGEYVMRAAAVRKYGTGLLSALNGMRIPRPTGFNMGGLVDGMQRSLSAAMIPGFASGGLAALAPGGRPLTLVIDNGASRTAFAGLIAPADVADKIIKYSNSRQLTSGGRKSSAFK